VVTLIVAVIVVVVEVPVMVIGAVVIDTVDAVVVELNCPRFMQALFLDYVLNQSFPFPASFSLPFK
jgi:hypothetical protein